MASHLIPTIEGRKKKAEGLLLKSSVSRLVWGLLKPTAVLARLQGNVIRLGHRQPSLAQLYQAGACGRLPVSESGCKMSHRCGNVCELMEDTRRQPLKTLRVDRKGERWNLESLYESRKAQVRLSCIIPINVTLVCSKNVRPGESGWIVCLLCKDK